MAINFKLLRSSTQDKRPTTAQVADGELALNTHQDSGGIFYKNGATEIVKVGPVQVSTTAPNSSAAGSTGNSIGEQWLDISLTSPALKIWNGSAWVLSAGESAPSTSADTQVIFNNAGTLDGTADFTYNSTANQLTVGEVVGQLDGAIRFTAQAGENITFGQVVYISGASGDTPIVSLARANSASTMPAYGFALADTLSGNSLQIVTFGSIEGSGSDALDTSGEIVNNVVYVSPTTAGDWTTTKPTGEGNLLQNIGRIQRVQSSNGVIKVGGAGRTNATPNLNDGNIFVGNGSGTSVASGFTDVLDAQTGITTATNDLSFARDIIVENQGDVRFLESTVNGTNFIALQAPATVTTDTTLTLPNGDGDAGDVLATDAAGNLYWALPGAGQKGETGIAGAKGQKGEEGASVTGAKGQKGEIGVGTKGQKGEDGASVTGAKGQKGEVGPDGASVTGAKGQKGEVGPDGASVTGAKGQKGEVGPDGASVTGAKGQKGEDGASVTGAKGQKGEDGSDGQKGATGAASKGQKGEEGVGTKGQKGEEGIGTKGQKGEIGPDGQKGTEGQFGGATFDYSFDTDTGATDPGSGDLKLNNGTVSSADKLYINDLDQASADISAFLQTIANVSGTAKGYFRLANRLNAADFAVFEISDLTDNTGWWTVDSTYITGPGSFSSAEDIIISFQTHGNSGAKGQKGAEGAATKGQKGEDGGDGQKGATGATGTAVKGQKGEDGTEGQKGATGAATKGQKGEDGASVTGAKGQKGEVGPDGASVTGAKGQKGEVGPDGASVTGAKGQKGEVGGDGQKGATGATGTGTKGQKGEDGASVTGAKGQKGEDGASVTGAKGQKGEVGGDGQKGTTGSDGTKGQKGLDGGSVDVATTAPGTPSQGDLWYNEAAANGSGRLYMYYQDGSSNQWVDTNPSVKGQKGADGTVSPDNITILDALTFDGSTTTFNLLSSSSAYNATNAQQFRVDVGGVIQRAGVDYTVDAAANTITFTTAPAAGLTHQIIGFTSIVLNVPSDASVSTAKIVDGAVTSAKLSVDATILPTTDDSFDLGSASFRFANVYTGDLHLANDRGNWTIIEEEDALTMRNNLTGKIYNIMMSERA